MRKKIINLCEHALLWTGVSKNIEEGYTILWGNYHISRHATANEQNGAGFMVFNRVRTNVADDESFLSVDFDSKPKLHIALSDKDHLDPNSDIQTAFNAILKVLDENNIRCFKVVLSSRLSALIESGQYGKIFTVYLAGGSESEAIKIAKTIEASIKSAKTCPPLKPPAQTAADCVTRRDHRISDCGFVTRAENRRGIVRFNLIPIPADLQRIPSKSASYVSEMLSDSIASQYLLPRSTNNVVGLFPVVTSTRQLRDAPSSSAGDNPKQSQSLSSGSQFTKTP